MPSSTIPKMAVSMTLLNTSALSRLTTAKRSPSLTVPARKAKIVSAAPILIASSARMKVPRSGSTAKAWTLVSTPERTKKVPIIDMAKATTPSITVHARKALRDASTETEWSSAVAASHGIRLAFSTGSQNHQPPQPSS